MFVRTARRPAYLSAALTAALVGVMIVTAPPVPAATPQLPDLRMAKLTNIQLDTTTIAGHRLLRYTAQLVNTGTGPFETRGSRKDTSATRLLVHQWIYDSAGNVVQKVPVPKTETYMYWAGDGHNHFHIADLEDGTLTRVSSGRQVGSLAKHGFHLVDSAAFDTSIPGAPSSAIYGVCGGHSCDDNALRVYMGISAGWLDQYYYTTVGQYIDITGLPNGKYVLRDVVDPQHWFTETNTTNNWASATLRIGDNGVQKITDDGGV
jgi:hypothetical protein